MGVLTIIRNEVEVYVLKMQIKDLNPNRIKSHKWIQEHGFTPKTFIFVTCNKEGEIKFTHPKQKYKIHKIIKGDPIDEEIIIDDVKELLYEDYYTFAIVDYLEETIIE